MKYLKFLFVALLAAAAANACSDNDPEITPDPGPQPPVEEKIVFNVKLSDASVEGVTATVTSNSKEAQFYCDVWAVADLGADDAATVRKIEALAADKEAFARNLRTGAGAYTLTRELTPAVEYCVLVIGYDGGKFTSELVRSATFNVEAPAVPDPDFQIEILSADFTAIEVRITPKDLQAEYFVTVDPVSKFAADATDEQILATLWDFYGMLISWGMYIEKGVKTVTNDDTGELEPDTDYYVSVFGLVDKAPSTTLTKQVLHTSPAGDPANVVFTSKVEEITSKSASVTVTPNDNTVFYLWDVLNDNSYQQAGGTTADFTEKILPGWLNEGISDSYPTIADVVKSSNVRGEANFVYKTLLAETSYRVWAVSVDPAGKPLSAVYMSEPFTTEARVVSDATALNDFSKIYDGDALYAKDPSSYAKYQGMCYLPVTVSHNDKAAHWYSALTTDNNLSDITDDELATFLIREESHMDAEQVVYAAPWGMSTLLAVACDADGIPGEVDRWEIWLAKSMAAPITDLIPDTAAQQPMRLSSVMRYTTLGNR